MDENPYESPVSVSIPETTPRATNRVLALAGFLILLGLLVVAARALYSMDPIAGVGLALLLLGLWVGIQFQSNEPPAE